MCSGNTEIGVEITEAIPKQYAHFCAVAQQKYPDHWLPAIHPLWDAPSFTDAEMQVLLEKSPAKVEAGQAESKSANLYIRRVASGGWVADQAEREWANFILQCIDAKLKTLANPEFCKRDQNWLSIYDNLPLPNVNLAQAVAILRPCLTERWRHCPSFGSIFVERSFTVVWITANTSKCFAATDLWSVQ
jgi:hypothetical protein